MLHGTDDGGLNERFIVLVHVQVVGQFQRGPEKLTFIETQYALRVQKIGCFSFFYITLRRFSLVS